MGKFDFVKPSPLSAGATCSASMTATFPRNSSASGAAATTVTFVKPLQPKKPSRLDLSRVNGAALSAANRSTTLPHRNSGATFPGISCVANADADDSNPLRILRDKSFPIVRPRVKTAADQEAGAAIPAPTLPSPCESPSYILHTSTNQPGVDSSRYSFSERDVRAAAAGADAADHINPVPLPPRDRNKVMQTNVKRHVRKYPLIIPVAGLQRNLSKVTQPSPVEEQAAPLFPAEAERCAADDRDRTGRAASMITPNSCGSSQSARDKQSPQQNGFHLTQRFIENNFPGAASCLAAACAAPIQPALSMAPCATYENMDTLRHMQQQQQHLAQDCTDSASLHFESILEDGCHQADAMASPEVNKDFMFDIHKDVQVYRQKAAEAAEAGAAQNAPDEIRNLDIIEAKKLEFAQRYPSKYSVPAQNELASHSLFNKVKEQADSEVTAPAVERPVSGGIDEVDHAGSMGATAVQQTAAAADQSADGEDGLETAESRPLQHSNSVSCEDLLEFSDQKPKGRERGVESDEVRIMTKVLGTMATADQFIEALDFIDWNVHKAIKLIMLRSTLHDLSLTLQQCVDALQQNEWDMQVTTLKLKNSSASIV